MGFLSMFQRPLITVKDNAQININVEGSEVNITANNIKKAKTAALVGPKAKNALVPPNAVDSLLLAEGEDSRAKQITSGDYRYNYQGYPSMQEIPDYSGNGGY